MSARTLIHGTAKQTARQSRHRFHAHFRAFRSAEHRAHRLLHRNHENAVHEVLPDLPRLTHAHVPSAAPANVDFVLDAQSHPDGYRISPDEKGLLLKRYMGIMILVR